MSPFADFKTSYVEVYLVPKFKYNNIGVISKHLMLKFIFTFASYVFINCYFKTSYVEVYHGKVHLLFIAQKNFKTSYVEVYPFGSPKKE